MKRKQDESQQIPSLELSPLTRAVRNALFCGSVAVIASMPVNSTAYAQEDETERRGSFAIKEIVVTATQRESTVFDVPYSISVLTGSQIKRSGVQDLSDLVRAVPGIGYLEQGPRVANNNNYIILRGLNATSQSGAADTPFLAEPVVSTYFGNTPIFANSESTAA